MINITAVLLVGGMGTRLRSVVSSGPKPLARVGKLPFLELLVRQLQTQGIRRIVMCTGYLAEEIEKAFGNGRSGSNVTIQYSREDRPLGTAGAIKRAQNWLEKESAFLVMNGDSFLEADLSRLIRFHRDCKGLASLALVRVEDAGRYGTVQVDSEKRVVGFREKTGDAAPGLINAGVYVFNREIFDQIPDVPSSLERDIFPQVLQRGIYGLETHGMFIDIGTPEDYSRAQALCDRLSSAAGRK